MVNDFLPRRPSRGQNQNPQQWQRPASFQTPEAIAADQQARQQSAGGAPLIGSMAPAKPRHRIRQWFAHLNKKQWALLIAVAVIVLGGGGAAAALLLSKDEPTPKKQAVATEKPAPQAPAVTTVPSKLTGLPVDPSLNEKQVTAIMIENSTDARPQSGLNDAGVVFEAVAEGGITRFLTLFQDTAPEYVGPVRSVRPYYVQWLRGFDAAVAHVGGSNEALAMLKRGEAKDLDQFVNAGAFWRVNTRFAPHNMYTSLPKLQEVEARRGYTKSDYTAIPRNVKESPSKAPTARTIDFNISGPIYNAHYDYDQPSNSYKRSEGGKPHTDEKSGTQLAPKVVVGLVMPQGRNGIYTTYQTIGSGQAYIFQDGIVTTGTWHKANNQSNFTFTDAQGAELKLNPGQTWFTVVGSTDRVTYRP
jgi:hypothetical protein